MSGMRLGVLGGTFDPVHQGHLSLARACAAALSLDEVRLMASRVPPHKAAPVAGAFHRHAMLALAAAPFADFVADPRELEREGVSFTIDTLEQLRAERPGAEILFLAGADSLRDFGTWRRHEDILKLATVATVARAGVDLAAAASALRPHVEAGRIVVVPHEPPPWRSRDLRRALASGAVPPGAIPQAVLDYIRRHRLYA